MKNKKTVFLIILALIVLLVVLKKTGVIGTDSVIGVNIEKLKKRTIIETISASGKIKPQIEVKISPEVSGEIIEINVKEGQKVNEGDLLVKIKPDIYISALERAKASLNTAKANLANAQARYEQVKAQLIQAEQNFNRYKRLYEQKAISQSDYENALVQYEIKKADLKAAEQNITASVFSVKSAEATVKEAYENLNKTTIYAPMSGTVSKIKVEKGERVVGTTQMAGTELLRIANLDKLEVNVDVTENDIIRIKPGDTAKVEIDAYINHPFKGVVTEVANSANENVAGDQVTTFAVKVLILPESYSNLKQKIQYPLRPGMSATVDIVTSIAKDVLSVPVEAVITKEDENRNDYEAVFVCKDGVVFEKKINTGVQDDNYIEVKEGLNNDEYVVVGPYETISNILKDSMKVNVLKKVDDE